MTRKTVLKNNPKPMTTEAVKEPGIAADRIPVLDDESAWSRGRKRCGGVKCGGGWRFVRKPIGLN